MLNVGLRVLIASSLVLTAVACGKSTNKKPSMGKTRRDTQQGSDWAKDAMGAASGCMKLDVLTSLIAKLDKELVSVHTVDLDFVRVDAVPGRPLTEAEKKANKVATTYYQISRLENISEILKANYFLKDHYTVMAETYPGSQITTASAQLDNLLRVKGQNGCAQVMYEVPGTNQVQSGDVVESSPRAIKVRVGANEYRTYQMFGRDQLLVAVIKPAGPIPACEGRDRLNERPLVRRSYILSKSSSRDRYQVSKPLASMYYGFVYDTPELLGRPERGSKRAQAKPDDRRRNQRNPPQERTDYVALSGTTLDFIARALDKDLGLPALTCTTAPKTKPQQ